VQKSINKDGIEFSLNWPLVPADVQEQTIALWEAHNALPANTDTAVRAQQAIAFAKDSKTGNPLGVATVQLEHMDWVGQPMFRYRTFAVRDARLRSISVQMVNYVFDLLTTYSSDTGQGGGLYMEIENRQLMQHQNEGVWFESRCSYIGLSPEGWHRRVRYFPHARLSL
tara:strand:+ start:7305 stop:7811 length:507 start_codon:yes stop_codon:yes gene_type:complete